MELSFVPGGLEGRLSLRHPQSPLLGVETLILRLMGKSHLINLCWRVGVGPERADWKPY